MLKKIKNAFAYTKIDYNSLEKIRSKIVKANLQMVTVLSSFATLLIVAMLIASFFNKGIHQNRQVYFIGLIMSFAISISSFTIAKKHSKLVKLLVYLSYAIYYMYGILIGAVTDPEGKTVTFMVLLVFMPTLFIDWPMRIISITSFFVALFIMLCTHTKTGAVLSVDILDSLVFAALGLTSGFFVNNIKLHGFILEQQQDELSRKDKLTDMRNRNAYEIERDSIIGICKYCLSVIYMDVNGLHEINNAYGHEAGDDMLKFIASEIKRSFLDDYSYRIGGDEFVAFMPDKSEEEIKKIVDDMIKTIEENNYHVAVGYISLPTRHLSMDFIIKEAENKMKNDKIKFYKNNSNRKSRDSTNTYTNM